jgi:O-antigen/teichoic acid export membrane protein
VVEKVIENVPTTALKDAAVTGVRWTMFTRTVREIVALGTTVALAHLITPSSFGRAAVALALLPLATILTYEGFASVLVQKRSLAEAHIRSAVLLSLLAGGLLSALTFVLARPVGGAVFGHDTGALLQMASPLFVLAAVGAVPRGLLCRRLDFRAIGTADVGGLVANSVVSLSCAIAGAGGRSLIAGALAQTIASSALLYAHAPPPRPRWRRSTHREIVGFGMPAALAGLVHTCFSNVDYMIVAARMSAEQAGFYWRSFQLGVSYQSKLSIVMMQLAFPIYSRMENRAELGRMHQRAARVQAAVIFPMLALLVVLAPALVPWAFGAWWEPAVVPTQILAVAGMASAVLAGYPQVMLALGEPDVLLRFNLAKLAVYALAVLVSVRWGLTGLAITVAIVYAGIVVAVYGVLLGPRLGMGMRQLGAELGPALAGCTALWAATVPLERLLDGRLPAPLLLMAVGVTGLTVHCAVLRLLFAPIWHDLSTLAERVVPLRRRLRSARRKLAEAPSAG